MKKRVGIIGGGIVGCSLAYYLSLYPGIEPYVIEKDQLGSGTTSKSAGTVSLLDDSIPEDMFDLRVLALKTYIGMENESKGSAGFNDIGTLAICPFTDYGRQSLEFVQKAVEMSKRKGFSAEFFNNGTALKKVVPDLNVEGVAGGGYSRGDGWFNATGITTTFAENAKSGGATILTRTKATRILMTGKRVTGLETTKGTFDFDVVVNAAGPWAHDVGRMVSLELPVMHTKANVFVLKPRSPLSYDLPMLKHPRFYTKTEGPERVFACRAHLTMDLSEAQDAGFFEPDNLPLAGGTDPSALDYLASQLARSIPRLTESSVVSDYLAYRMESEDYLPILGESGIPGYMLAVGLGGNGVIFAPGVAQDLSKYIATGEKGELLRKLEFTRETRF
jgi:glycine/D-amino acid oxidase-like deaminating enzyme